MVRVLEQNLAVALIWALRWKCHDNRKKGFNHCLGCCRWIGPCLLWIWQERARTNLSNWTKMSKYYFLWSKHFQWPWRHQRMPQSVSAWNPDLAPSQASSPWATMPSTGRGKVVPLMSGQHKHFPTICSRRKFAQAWFYVNHVERLKLSMYSWYTFKSHLHSTVLFILKICMSMKW